MSVIGKNPLLNDLMQQCVADSQRWFPEVCPQPTDSSRQTVMHLTHHTLAMFGEVGEFANILKKMERGSIDFEDWEAQHDLAEELTDVFIYMLNIAGILNIDLLAEYNRKRALNEGRFGDGSFDAAGV